MPLFERFKEVILALLWSPFYLISRFIPKNGDLWVFGSSFGRGYADNSKYLFEYVNSECPEIEAVWISSRRAVVQKVRQKGYKAYLGHSIKGICAMMKCGAGIISYSKIRDLKPFLIAPPAKLVNLWHGVPLKKIGADDKLFCSKETLFYRIGFKALNIICPGYRRVCDMAIACSDEDKMHFSSGLEIPEERIKITGYPRNDALFRESTSRLSATCRHNGIYMPTFRGKEGGKFDLLSGFEKRSEEILEYLSKRDICLHIKLHPLNSFHTDLADKLNTSGNVRLIHGNDVYNILNRYDFLITDYSSIYFDYLLLDKPVIFSAFDIDEYLKSGREFYYDYKEVTPGPKASDWIEVIENISHAIDDPGKYKEERSAIRKRFHEHRDGASCARVVGEIKKII